MTLSYILKNFNVFSVLKDVVLFKLKIKDLKECYKLYLIYKKLKDRTVEINEIIDIDLKEIERYLDIYNKYTKTEKIDKNIFNVLVKARMLKDSVSNINIVRIIDKLKNINDKL